MVNRSEFLDDYFGLRKGDVSEKRRAELDFEVQKRSVDVVVSEFRRVVDELLACFSLGNTTFGELLFSSPPQRAPRYFQVLFLAFYHLLVEQGKVIESRGGVVESLRNAAAKITIQEGGRWGAENRSFAVSSLVGVLQKSFVDGNGSGDPAIARWVLQFENLLTNSFTEQPLYDFKQGVLRLDNTATLDQGAVDKILQTIVGIANIGPDTTGYVIIGVADEPSDAKRVEEVFGVAPTAYRGFYITGVAHEAEKCGRNLDQHFQWLAQLIEQSKISEPLRSYVRNNLRLVRYCDKAVFVIQVRAQGSPSHIDGRYFDRSGTQLKEIVPADLNVLFSRFAS